MSFSNNARYPFTFQTITGSAGAFVSPVDVNVPGQRYIGQAADSTGCYTVNEFTIQRLTLNSATPVFPELSDFFDSNYIEFLNDITYDVTRAPGSIVTPTLIKTLFSRYVIVVYKQTFNTLSQTIGLIFDSQLKRVGRLKFITNDVVDMIEWHDSIAYVTSVGAIYTADTGDAAAHTGLLMIGKFQHVRNSMLTLQAVAFESVIEGDNFIVSNLATLTGDNFLPEVVLYPQDASGALRNFLANAPGMNHTIVCKGKFDLQTLEIEYVVEGMR
jgi:hypothetical protein